MATYVHSNAAWKAAKAKYVFTANAWKRLIVAYAYSDGAWKPLDKYQWITGDWGDCSVSCGGGTQTRSVQCVDSLGNVVPDSFCALLVGEKPDDTQPCNTQSCTVCAYSLSAPAYSFINGSVKTVSTWTTYTYSTSVTFNGVSIASGLNGTLSSVTSGGYTYTRGAYKTQTVSSWGSNTYTTSYYEVCRT